MSFILDALRKSDQQRQRSATPTLASARTSAVEPGQPALLWYGVIAAVLVGAGILIGWLQQTPPQPLPVALPPAVTKPVEAPAFTSAPRPPFPETMRKPEAPPATPVPQATPPAVAVANAPTSTASPLPLPAAVASAPKAVSTPDSANAAGDASREPTVMQLSELPPAIQQEIPKLTILAHSYSSKPKARFVFINDQMVHEEDYPAPGLKLEQITPDGMVFSYKGYRFRRGADSDIR
ncbi:MAG: hypothetical protein D4S02_08025 [Rhodocyclaceae bacterium]|nr:MAG: hypothetical protein D4S02_08025 [Rhodocyclaceae bacterium]